MTAGQTAERKNNMGFITELRNTVNNYHSAVLSAEKDIADFGQKYAGYYSPAVFNEKLREYVAKRDEAVRAGNEAVIRLANEYKERAKSRDVVKGEELTADAQLLESSLPLTKSDLEAIFDRSAGNNTMQLLVMRKADRDGINVERVYTTGQDVISGIDRMTGYAKASIPAGVYYESVWASDTNFDKIVPEAVRSL